MLQGLKPGFYWAFDVAAEAATHKAYLLDGYYDLMEVQPQVPWVSCVVVDLVAGTSPLCALCELCVEIFSGI